MKNILLTIVLLLCSLSFYKAYKVKGIKERSEKLDKLGVKHGVFHINFSNTKATNEDLLLTHGTYLESIDISNTSISKLEALYIHEKLKVLTITGTNIPKEEIDRIKTKLPNLQIKD